MSFLEESSFIREYLWKYRKLVFWGVLALSLVDILEIVPPLLLKETVDAIGTPDAESKLLKIVGIYMLVSVFQSIGRYAWRFFLIRTSMFSGRDLRERYAKHLFNLSPSFFDRKKIGDLMSLATSDIEAIRMSMGGGLIIFLDALVYLITVPIAMFYLSWELTVLSLLPLLIVPFVVIRNERLIHKRFTEVQEAFSKLAALAQENIMGIRVVKGFARENAQSQKFRNVGIEFVKRNLELSRVQSGFGPVLDFIMSLGMILMLYFGGAKVIDSTLTLGTFVAFQRYIQKMIWPMTAVGLSVSFYQRAVAGSNRLKEVLVEKTDTPEPETPILPVHKTKSARGKWQSEGRIVVKNLTFSYSPKAKPVLKNISMNIEPGKSVAFVGSIGSGKSTLLHLFPRLYAVPRNSIWIDGVDVNDWPLKDLRDQFGMVSQDTFLFSETVFENVAFGLFEWAQKDDRKHAVLDATQKASVHPDILKLDRGYDTVLGERGLNVSGGQRQRLTIARAMACEPPILILDDALSAVDVETESHILTSLHKRPKRNTEIIAAHRISSVKDCDLIYVFKDGEIIQQGKHNELLRSRDSLYWRFYESQRLQAEVEAYGQQPTT